MSASPVISVIMACYNEERHLGKAVDSILNQTFSDFEFIIVNDCSTDTTLKILESYKDPRIKIFSNDENGGLAYSLNVGIDKALGKYIARMDADDISLPTRLEEQFNIMEKYPDIGLCGTYAEFFGKADGIRKHDSASDLLKCKLLFSSQFCHPTVMFKTDVLKKNKIEYHVDYKQAQDYELWVRLIPYCDFYTIEKPLVKYRVHQGQVSDIHYDSQNKYRDNILEIQLNKLGIKPTPQQFNLHKELAYFDFVKSYDKLVEIRDWFEQLVKGNDATKFYPEVSFRKFMADYLFSICYNSATNGLKLNQLFYQSALSNLIQIPLSIKMKFWVKCFLKLKNNTIFTQLSTIGTDRDSIPSFK